MLKSSRIPLQLPVQATAHDASHRTETIRGTNPLWDARFQIPRL